MKTIKVSEATNTQLDWLVAKCEGHQVGIFNTGEVYLTATPWANKKTVKWLAAFKPSVAWSQMGPIVEREKLCSGFQHQLDSYQIPTIDPDVLCWARTTAGGHLKYGPTVLIAAARCYVVSKMGDTVEVPEELC